MAISLRAKPEKQPADDERVAQLGVLSASIDALVKRDDELREEQLAIERSGTLPTISLDLLLENRKATVVAKNDQFSATTAARQLLNGHLSPEPVVGSAPHRIDQIVMERAAAQIAVRLGRQKQNELRLALSAVLGAAEIARWRELLADEAERLAAAVVQLGDEFRDLDQRYRRATGVDPDFTGELPGGFAFGQLAGEARAFLQRGDVALALACQTMGNG
jgi:hypothetical protein